MSMVFGPQTDSYGRSVKFTPDGSGGYILSLGTPE